MLCPLPRISQDAGGCLTGTTSTASNSLHSNAPSNLSPPSNQSPPSNNPQDAESEHMKLTEQRIKYMREKLEGESDLISDLKDSVKELDNISKQPTSNHSQSPSNEKPALPDKELIAALNNLHSCDVPDTRKGLLHTLSQSYNLTCQQLGLVLSQLRYLAEKDVAVHLFCPGILDPENLSDMIDSLEEGEFQERVMISSIVNSVTATLLS